MPDITVQKFTQRSKAKPVDLYLGAVSASEVIERSRVDIQSAENPKGYQRALQPSRVRSIARYVDRGEGLLPTSLGLNIRNGAWFEEDSPGSSYGKLHFSEEEPWWVWEGQHRSGGVAEAIRLAASRKRKPEELGYDLPVTFSIGFSRDEEMDLFDIVNSKQRPVPTNLVASITFNRVMEERDKDEPGKISLPALRRAAGVGVGRYLADRPPWNGHILGVNEPKDNTNKPMQANTFASTLMPLMRERWVHTRFLTNPEDKDFTELSKIVQRYWETLAELMPEAFADIAPYSVQRPVGVYAFHELLPEVMDACRMENDWSAKSFRSKLERLDEWVESATWHRETGEDIIKGSGNRAAIKVVVERMRTLFHAPLTGLDEPDFDDEAADS